MPLDIVFRRPQNWSRLKPYYESTITAVKGGPLYCLQGQGGAHVMAMRG